MRWLAPLSWLYGVGVRVRNRRFDEGRGVARLPVPVVSVGNISVGGSGKTPFVAAVARELLARGERVGILSRGYGRRVRTSYVLVSDGTAIRAPLEASGDEPYELAHMLPSVAIAVGPDRAQVGARLVDEVGPRVLLLDDGFQHRRLHRDLDLVCVDTAEPASARRLLPEGRLREPVSALERADAVIARGGSPDFVPPGIPVVRTSTTVSGFESVGGGGPEVLPPDRFAAASVGLMCAIARPERVKATVSANVVFDHFERDHHWWSEREIARIARAARARGASALLTTLKDAVKLRALASTPFDLPIYAIRIECRVEEPEVLRGLLRDICLPPE